MYGHQAGQKKKIRIHIYLGLRFQCMYCTCINIKLDGIVGVGTCYGLGFDCSGCKKLSSPYSSRPAHQFSLQWVLGLFPGCGVDYKCQLQSAIHSHGIPLLPLGRFSRNLIMRYFVKTCLKKWSLIKWFIVASSWIFPVRNVWYRSFRENQKEHFMFDYIFLKIVLFCERAW
jgi:hypothetical protein